MDFTEVLNGVRAFVEARDYAGHDPYDGLNSPLLNTLSRHSKWLRIAFIQAMKRSPIDLRALLGVPKGHNPKGIGLFLWGYAKLFHATRRDHHLSRCRYLVSLLEQLRSNGYHGNSWGYNFDWQSRAAMVRRGTPTVVNSAFIGHGLLDTHRWTGDPSALDLAVPIAEFLLNDLRRKREGDTFCFSYTPHDDNYVHNANLLGASLLIRLADLTGQTRLRDPALASLAYSMNHQHANGAWYYAEPAAQNWVDSFHTGFNLQAIRWFLAAGHATEYKEAFDRGVDYYATNFFLDDGTPKYYDQRVWPIDVHSPAQALAFFSEEGPRYAMLTERVLRWFLDNMYSHKGYFYFQKRRRYTNRICYMRWGQAWAFHGLTSCLTTSGICS